MTAKISTLITAEAAELVCGSVDPSGTEHGRAVIAIDGRCAGGKTMLARAAETLLRERGIPCRVLHADDFFLRPEQRTLQRMAEAGGNMDYERLLSEVLLPLSRGESFVYRPYRCHGEQPEPYTVEPNGITIIEGAYCCRPELRSFYDRCFFVDIESGEQSERILRRNGAERARTFAQRWIPLEERYIAECRPQLSADAVFRLMD